MWFWWLLNKRMLWGCGFSRCDGHAIEASFYLYHTQSEGMWQDDGLLRHMDSVIDPPPEKVMLCYCE